MDTAIGFRNTGAICWLNSLLQSLLSSKQFVELLNEDSSELQKELKRIKGLYSSASEQIIDPTPLLAAMMSITTIDLSGQQSASEGMTLLLDTIKSKEINDLFMHKYEEQVIIRETGRVVSNINAFNNQFMFFDEETLLRENIEEFIKYHETPLRDYKLEDSNGKLVSSNFTFKRAYILRYIPKIIVILLNRYRTTGRTVHPRNPNIKLVDNFNIKNKITKKMMNFKKIAEIDQQGILDGGHYYCRVLRGGRVYTINDSHVSPAVFETNPNTYMTFYERLE